jgi:hypothetical protein
MDESTTLSWEILPSWYIQPFVLVVLGLATCATDLLSSDDTPVSTTVFLFVSGLALILAAFVLLRLVPQRVSCDATGRFHFISWKRDVVADPGTIFSVRRWKAIEWPTRGPLLVTTTMNRVILTSKYKRRSELREALLRANPLMKIGPRTLQD